MNNVKIQDTYDKKVSKKYLKMNLKNLKILLIQHRIIKLNLLHFLIILKPHKKEKFLLLIENFKIEKIKNYPNFQKIQKNKNQKVEKMNMNYYCVDIKIINDLLNLLNMKIY